MSAAGDTAAAVRRRFSSVPENAEEALVSNLSDLLAQVNGGKRSGRAIAIAAQEKGFSLNHDTAARYLRGDHGTPDEATLRAFAAVLPVSLKRLRSAAELPADTVEPYTPPPESSRLNRRQRRAVDEVIRAMLNSTASGATVSPLPAKPRKAAARRGRTD